MGKAGNTLLKDGRNSQEYVKPLACREKRAGLHIKMVVSITEIVSWMA